MVAPPGGATTTHSIHMLCRSLQDTAGTSPAAHVVSAAGRLRCGDVTGARGTLDALRGLRLGEDRPLGHHLWAEVAEREGDGAEAYRHRRAELPFRQCPSVIGSSEGKGSGGGLSISVRHYHM